MATNKIWKMFLDPNISKKVVGKWIFEAPKEIFAKYDDFFDTLVENGQIPEIKYALKDSMYDPCPYKKESVLCVYTYKKNDKAIRDLVVSNCSDLRNPYYKTEAQTIKDWSPKGGLYKEYKEYWEDVFRDMNKGVVD